MANEIKDFFNDLFATDLWPPRWQCGYWSDFHGWMYIASDLMIWFSYFAIPVIILSYIYRKKFELSYTNTYILFATFILLCGSTHLLDAYMFWTPMYRLNALVRLITGVVSLLTVVHLIRILPDAFRKQTSAVLEKEIARRMEVERKLSEANTGLQMFAYMASHDLQEPLRKINLFTTRVYETNESNFDSQSLQWTQKVLSASDRMQNIIKDILNLSSISDAVQLKPTDLNDVIREAQSDLEVRIIETGAKIQVGKLPMVNGHHEYLVQVFANLISNAIKFSKEKPLITIDTEKVGLYQRIFMRDNGIGMNPDDTGKIFQAFQRLHPKSAYEGSGIGLAICKKIIDIHQGSITVESVLNQGTTFIIDLPSADV